MKKSLQRVCLLLLLAMCVYSIVRAQQRQLPPLQSLFSPIASQQAQTEALNITEREALNVKAFGARGDGRTDDTEAIRRAVEFIGKARGGKLLFPNGMYIVTSAIDLPSGITIEGTSGLYNGGCQIRLTTANQTLFTIGEFRRRITIRDIELKAAPESVTPYTLMKGTIAVAFSGAAPNSTIETEFRNMTFTSFDKGISCVDSKGQHSWQCDNVTIDHCSFSEYNYGIFVDSQNAANWKITNCEFTGMSASYAIYLQNIGYALIEASAGSGPPQAIAKKIQQARTFIYIGGGHGPVTVLNSQCEEVENFMEVAGAPNYSYPITLINNVIGPHILLRTNCIFNSIGNTYDAGTVRTIDAGNDVLIQSFGDVAEMPINSGVQPRGATPFKLQGASRVNFISGMFDVNFGVDVTLDKHMAIGTKVATDAVLNLATVNEGEPLLRLGNTSGFYYDIFRDGIGYLNFKGNQRGYVGFRFNGDLVPMENRAGNLGTDAARWGSVHAVKVVSGDAILSDKETGEELYRIREDKDNIFFEDVRTGKQLMRLDREGNLHVRGKVLENSP